MVLLLHKTLFLKILSDDAMELVNKKKTLFSCHVHCKKNKRLLNSKLDNAFLLSNAQIIEYPIEYPIVYCNEGFTKLSGFSKSELMQKSSLCSFMWGDLTDDETKIKVEDALKNNHAENLEVLIYKKNSMDIL